MVLRVPPRSTDICISQSMPQSPAATHFDDPASEGRDGPGCVSGAAVVPASNRLAPLPLPGRAPERWLSIRCRPAADLQAELVRPRKTAVAAIDGGAGSCAWLKRRRRNLQSRSLKFPTLTDTRYMILCCDASNFQRKSFIPASLVPGWGPGKDSHPMAIDSAGDSLVPWRPGGRASQRKAGVWVVVQLPERRARSGRLDCEPL
jgi:hypothetical protein